MNPSDLHGIWTAPWSLRGALVFAGKVLAVAGVLWLLVHLVAFGG